MPIYTRRRLTLFVLTALTPGTYAHASPRYEVVAASGRQAPGTGAGTTFGTLGFPAMNDAGQVVYNATLNNAAASNNSGMWVDDTLVARAGDAAPGGVPELQFRVFSTTATPVINNAGMVAFSTRPMIPGVTFAGNDLGVWAGRPGELQLVAMAGMHAPELGHNAVFRVGIESGGGIFPAESPGAPALSESGQVAFWADIQEGGSIYHALYAGPPGSMALVARANEPAEGLPAGTTHALLHPTPLIDGAGNVMFLTTLQGPGVSSVNQSANYLNSAGIDRLLSREDDPVAAVPGGRWAGSGARAHLNEAGQILLADDLRGVPTGTGSTLWFAEPDEPLRLVARAGQVVPGSPEHRFGGTFARLHLNDSGRVAFTARADPAGSGETGPLGLWTGTSDDFDLVLVEGAPAPGTAPGIEISRFLDTVAVNANGVLAFTAQLRGEGVSMNSNDALFGGTPEDLRLLLREGDYLEVAPGDSRQVRLIRFGTGGRPHFNEYLLNDNDQVAAWVRFADGTDAIFRIAVPEPTALPLVVAGTGALLRRRRRRRFGIR